MSINRVTVSGRMATDVTMRDINGSSVASFNIVTDTEAKDESGKYLPMFYAVSAWGKKAEVSSKYLKKGERVLVIGNLSQRTYKDQYGTDKTQNRITASDIDFLGGGARRTAEPSDELPI